MQPKIRSYRPDDLESVYDICVRTGDNGGDARGQHVSDRLLGDVYAAPYVVLEPETARILDDGTGRAVGYIVGTRDTPEFVTRFRQEWMPRTAGLYSGDDWPIELLNNPESMLRPEIADYPAHLHIDLLPDWQGKGLGRQLMSEFLAGLHAAGVLRVHLGVSPKNTGARAFYDRLGFKPIAEETLLGRETAT